MDVLSIAQVLVMLPCAIALGGMLFFAPVFAPLVFRNPSPAAAGSFLRQVARLLRRAEGAYGLRCLAP